jgi:hypothetical protein
MRVKATYKAELKIRMPIINTKLKEKMIINNDANIETIIKANREMGKPKMTARFLMFLYTSYFFI